MAYAYSGSAGTQVIHVSMDLEHAGINLCIADEGTPHEHRVLLDRYAAQLRTFSPRLLFQDLLPGFHTLRVIGGVDKTGTDYASHHDALISR